MQLISRTSDNASWMLAEGVPATTAAARLGHSLLEFQRTYAHALAMSDPLAVRALNNMNTN